MEHDRRLHSDMRRMALGVTSIPSLLVAMASYKLLALLLFMETLLLPGTVGEGSLALPAQVLLFLACTLVCLGYAVFFRRLTFCDKGWYWGLLTICLMLGVFLLLMREMGGVGNAALALLCRGLGIVLVAVGIIGVHIELGRIMGALGMTQTLAFGVASAFMAGVLYLALVTVPGPLARWVAAFVLPVVMALSYGRAHGIVYRSRRPRDEQDGAEALVPGRFIATSVAQGTAVGLLAAHLFVTGGLEPAWNAIGYFLAAGLTLALVLTCKLDFNRSVYQIGFPLVGVGLLCTGLAGGALGSAGTVLQITGFLFLDLVLWGLGSYLIKNCGQPATWVASCPTTSLMAGRTAGMAVGAAVLCAPPEAGARGLVLCVAAFLLVLTALMLSNSANLRTGWGFVRPGNPEEDTDARRACQIVAEDFGLTQRELDVLQRIVAGESRTDVAASLYIAPNTLKTHLHSIYTKLDVHTERDLRAYVGDRRRTFAPSFEIGEISENGA